MRDKHFPTIIGVIFLIIILVAGVYLSTRTTTLSSSASGSCQPINPQVTNLTNASFDFSFTTASSCSATLALNSKIFQDSSTVPNAHYFKISGLSPTTAYQFSLISGGVTYTRPEYSLTTAAKSNTPVPSSNLAWGKVIDSASKPVSGAIIYLTIPGSQALSAFSNKDGNWNISFATSFNENKTDWFNPAVNVEEDIIVYSPDGLLTQLTNRSDNNDPVPDIIVGQNYFSIIPTSPPSSDDTVLDSNVGIGAISLSLTSPKESETISTLKPDIFGNGPAAAVFKLVLDGKSADVTIGSNNIWHWSPLQDLSLGSHQLVLTYQGKNITRNFSVSQNDNFLSFSSTPSATLVPTSPPSTPTPTVVVRTAKPSTTSALYRSGETFPTYFLIIVSSLLFGVSLYYYRR